MELIIVPYVSFMKNDYGYWTEFEVSMEFPFVTDYICLEWHRSKKGWYCHYCEELKKRLKKEEG